jgi:hypothetical protein
MGVATPFRPAGRITGMIVVCLIAVGACSGSPSPSLSPSAQPAAVADPLTGTWTTRGLVTCEQMDAAIMHAGFTPEERKAISFDPAVAGCPAAIVISFRDGRLTINLNGTDEWGPGPYRVTDAHTFEAGDDCDYCVRYDFELAGDELRVDVVKDDDPGGLEDYIAQTAIYESVPFERTLGL